MIPIANTVGWAIFLSFWIPFAMAMLIGVCKALKSRAEDYPPVDHEDLINHIDERLDK